MPYTAHISLANIMTNKNEASLKIILLSEGDE
jgi:hypothetical protein